MLPFFTTTTLLLSLLTSIVSAYLTSPPTPSTHLTNCGTTIQEAKRLGCHFDLWSFVYYPPLCFNQRLHTHFHSQHNHDIDWRLTNLTPVSTADVLEGNYMELRPVAGHYHEWHCTYEWLRLVWALAEGRPLDKKMAETGHGWHCGVTLLGKEGGWGRWVGRGGNGEVGGSGWGIGMAKGGENETETRRNLLRFGTCGLTAEVMYGYGSRD